MFYTILPLSPPVFAVQPDEPNLSTYAAGELIGRLQRHFQHSIALVSWDAEGKYVCLGFPVDEDVTTAETLDWREFELPEEPEVPF